MAFDKMLVESTGNNYNEIMLKFQETTYKRIVEELIDDAILEVCFEVHRAAKLGYFDLEFPKTEEYQLAENTEEKKSEPTVKSKNLMPVNCAICPICKKKKIAAIKFANHLASCMNLASSTTRLSSRAASQKIADSDALSNFDENDYDSDSGNGKKSKKGRGKGNARRKAKLQGSANAKLMDLNVNYQEMTYEKRKEFLNQKCGVITKRSNTMCAKTFKCSQHTDEERINVRRILLKDMNGQIDVDTADANVDSPFMMDTFSTHPPQETNLL